MIRDLKCIVEEDIIIKEESITENTPIRFSHYDNKFKELHEKCSKYKQAHAYCKSIHFFYDKLIKITTLFLSSLTTYYISSHTEEEINPEDLNIDRQLTFATTFVSGVNAIFNFSEKIETHKSLNSDHLDLLNELHQTINTIEGIETEERIIKIYEDFHKKYTALNKRTSEIGIMRMAKSKFDII